MLCCEVTLYLYKSTMQPCMEYCCHVWPPGGPNFYLNKSGKLQKRLRRTVCPSLAASLEPLANRWNGASISLFYNFTLVDVHLNWLNWFRFLIPVTGPLVVPVNSNRELPMPTNVFPHTARFWNALPVVRFPLAYDLNGD